MKKIFRAQLVFFWLVMAALLAQNDEFVLIKGGSFSFGGSFEVNGGLSSHGFAAYTVSVNDFYMSPYEVTQKDYQAVCGENPSHFKGEQLPVEGVSWLEAVKYCNDLSKAAGLEPCYTFVMYNSSVVCDFSKNGYRLPTEAEWEYAARGGPRREKTVFAGSDAAAAVAWFFQNSGGSTQPVGGKKPNAAGLYDMSGNVWEWCWDYRIDPLNPDAVPVKSRSMEYSAQELRFADVASRDANHVLRGGSWGEQAGACTLTARAYACEGAQYDYAGFRLVRNAGPAAGNVPVYVKKTARDLLHSQTLSARLAVQTLTGDMLYVDGGTFRMGATRLDGRNEAGRKITLDAFYCSRYEVTLAQWLAVMKTPPRAFLGEQQGELPVTGVSWYEAVEFCNALSAAAGLKPYYTIDKTSQDPGNLDTLDTLKWLVTRNVNADGFRLPTEAEWEFVGRGGIKSQDPSYVGNANYIDPVGWYGDNSDYRAHPGGLKKENELGLFDLAGNVWEWCWDYYNEDEDLPSEALNPAGSASGIGRCIRGGGYDSENRYWFMPFPRPASRINEPEASAGLRLVRNAPQENVLRGQFF